MTRRVATAFCLLAQSLVAATILTEDFAATPNPSNVVGSLPLAQWHMDGDTEWQAEGWSGNGNNTVAIGDGTTLSQGLVLGWKPDNVEPRYVLNDNWDTSKDYTLTGDWEKKTDSTGAVEPWHLGFHVHLSEYSSSQLVQHVKSLHVAEGNVAVGGTGNFSITVTAGQLSALGVSATNHIGITFISGDDENLFDDGGDYDVQNDTFMVDNLSLSEDASTSQTVITQTVYVSESGTNTSTGLSPATAWRDVDALASRGFGPGAEVLFERGGSYSGACELLAKGTAINPVIISAYGSGAKPHLTGGSASNRAVFLLSSAEYLEFSDLHISNTQTNNPAVPFRYGVRFEAGIHLGELDHIYFTGLDFSDILGSSTNISVDEKEENIAIYATAYPNEEAISSSPTYWNDLRVTGCTFSNLYGRGIRIFDPCHGLGSNGVPPAVYAPTTGFICRSNVAMNCDMGLVMFRGLKNALLEYNTVDGTTLDSGIWIFGSEQVLSQYNRFYRIRRPHADGAACHFDYNCKDTVMQYNFGYDIEGALVHILGNSTYPTYFQRNAVARYNIGIDVGQRESHQGAGIFITGDAEDCKVYNNTIIQLSKPMTYGISFHNWGGEWPTNNLIYNNVFYVAGTNVVSHNNPDRFDDIGNVVSHNLYYGNLLPPGTDLNAFTNTPLFINSAGTNAFDFKVTHGASAIGAGQLIADNGGLDFFGNLVSAVTAPTLGAHEYASNPLIEVSTNALTVAEGGTSNIAVRLSELPASTITVDVVRVSGDTDVSISSGVQLFFTATNGTNWQQVTLAAAEDADAIDGAASVSCSDGAVVYLSATFQVFEADNETEAPTVVAAGAAPLTGSSAAIEGELTAGGSASVWFCWGASDAGSSATSSWDTVVSAGNVTQSIAFSNVVAGLSTNRTYYYRCYATNGSGTAWSEVAGAFNGVPFGSGDETIAAVGGDDIYLDAGLDDGTNSIWEDSLSLWDLSIDSGVSFVADAGSVMPGITSAYEFPGGMAGSNGCDGVSLTSLSADTSPITLELWFKPRQSASYPSRGQVLWETGGGTGLGIFYNDGSVDVAHDYYAQVLSSDVTALTNDFIQVVVTYDTGSTTDNYKLYVNGNLEVTASRNDGDMCAGDDAGLGNRGGSNAGGSGAGDASTESFDGHMAIFRSYHNQLLDADGVMSNYLSVAGLGPGIVNLAPTAVSTNQTQLNSSVNALNTNYDVYAYWGMSDGGTNAASWASSAYVGSWTNVSTNTSYEVSGLSAGEAHFYTFMASNTSGHVWGTPSWQFTTLGSPSVSTVETWIVSGQSNAEGYGIAASPVPGLEPATTLSGIGRSDLDITHPSIHFYQGANDYNDIAASAGLAMPPKSEWHSMTPYEGLTYDWGLGKGNESGRRFGPELAFGFDMQQTVGGEIALIKYARGSIPISSATSTEQNGIWKDFDPSDGGRTNHYDKIISTVQGAVDTLATNTVLNIRGVVWMQGEGDANATLASSYETNLTEFISTLRTDIASIAASSGGKVTTSASSWDELDVLVGSIQDPDEYSETVTNAQYAVAAADSHVFVVNGTTGLGMMSSDDWYGSNIHYNTEGQVELGERFAAKAVEILAAPATCTLTVTSPHGSDAPSGITTNTWHSTVAASVLDSPVIDGTTQYVCTGWASTGSLDGGSGTNTSFTITNDTTISWQWQTNYWLELSTTGN